MNELDQKVGEAIGWQYVTRYSSNGAPFWELGQWEKDGILAHYGPFRPSVDLNQAFELLEGLEWVLYEGATCYLGKTSGKSYTCCYECCGGCEYCYDHKGSGDTPAEAICRAFIAYKTERGE